MLEHLANLGSKIYRYDATCNEIEVCISMTPVKQRLHPKLFRQALVLVVSALESIEGPGRHSQG